MTVFGTTGLRNTTIAVAASVGLVLFGLSASSSARTVRTRIHANLKSSLHSSVHVSAHSSLRTALHSNSLRGLPLHVAMTGEEVVPGVMPDEIAQNAPDSLNSPEASAAPVAPTAVTAPEGSKPYRLHLSNLHTGEDLDIIYRIGNVYIPEALEKLNYFLRDRHTEDVVHYEPKEFDVLHALMSRLHRPEGLIDVVCGYRTPETNEALRNSSRNSGVAEHSQHMEGHAIDLRVPGVSTLQLRNTALSLNAGGVGYYPTSQFVHVDVGPVREWAFGRAPARPTAKRGVHATHHSRVASGD